MSRRDWVVPVPPRRCVRNPALLAVVDAFSRVVRSFATASSGTRSLGAGLPAPPKPGTEGNANDFSQFDVGPIVAEPKS